jgi:DNA-directed RNA polymerase subunit M/transcription elongation factor TFIIS
MGPLDSAAEWLRLTAHYRRMTDGELLEIARDPTLLVEAARQILAAEMSARGLKTPSPEPKIAAPSPEPEPDSPYAKDRELVELCKVWSLSDALQIQWLLDRSGIPFYIGPDKARAVDAGALNFADGVTVQVMRIGLPWASQAIAHYEPANEPAGEKEDEERKEASVTCPKCGSQDVIFAQLTPESGDETDESKSRFAWICDSCGNEWEDEGVAEEK